MVKRLAAEESVTSDNKVRKIEEEETSSHIYKILSHLIDDVNTELSNVVVPKSPVIIFLDTSAKYRTDPLTVVKAETIEPWQKIIFDQLQAGKRSHKLELMAELLANTCPFLEGYNVYFEDQFGETDSYWSPFCKKYRGAFKPVCPHDIHKGIENVMLYFIKIIE